MPKTIKVTRRWIASYNREWGVEPPSGGWIRGGLLEDALVRAAELVDPIVGGLIRVMPDKTESD